MKKSIVLAALNALLVMALQALALLLILAGQSFAFDMARDANAKQFTQKADHSKDDKRPVLNLQMKRPDNYPGNVVVIPQNGQLPAQNVQIPAQK
jgi:hypothetical protein